MSSLGRITNSLLSATNENTIALAFLNFDFTLVKYDAPKEYQALGESLSQLRRDNAEDGPIHKTARKLGALFESLVPSFPHLLKAYGNRASQIASNPKVNPKGNSKDGPFAAFVGADGASLWAAATSGKNDMGKHCHLAIHLLACLLARAWEPEESISIWVELVTERQKEIVQQIDLEAQSISSCMAARQEISRQELALWDTSARSWLRSADQAMFIEQTKLMLILKNLDMYVNHGGSTYESVISAWQQAISGMEHLVQGGPQDVSNGSVLVALSSWHIYPDLFILAETTKSVTFKDPLVQPGGTLTVGIQLGGDGKHQGMRWSLVLSHLRYYDTVEVNSEINSSRVSIRQLLLVAFGALMSSWKVPQRDENLAAEWFLALQNLSKLTVYPELRREAHLSSYSWLEVLFEASQEFLHAEKSQDEDYRLLVAWGRRRGAKFLGLDLDSSPPFFGLLRTNLHQTFFTPNLVELTILHLRNLAKERGYPSGGAIVRYTHQEGFHEYATVIPHRRLSDSLALYEDVHYRWLTIGGSGTNTFNQRRSEIEALGEECHPMVRKDFSELKDKHSQIANLGSIGIPALIEEFDMCDDAYVTVCPNSRSGTECACFAQSTRVRRTSYDYDFELRHGDLSGIGLWTILPARGVKSTFLETSADAEQLGIEEALKLFRAKKLDPNRVLDYLNGIVQDDGVDPLPRYQFRYRCMKTLAGKYSFNWHLYDSLIVLYIATRVYQKLPDLTVPLRITDFAFYEVEWARKFMGRGTRAPYFLDEASETELTKFEHLACLVTFESCFAMKDFAILREVFAVASGNSLFVDNVLLSEPLEVGKKAPVIRRIVGNIGKAGISLLTFHPGRPKVRPQNFDYRMVPHVNYDLQREDNFRSTSLHLSFTDWERPLRTFDRGAIDITIRLVEAVISVHDRGVWVADLITPWKGWSDGAHLTENWDCICNGDEKNTSLTSIDHWEELLDPPTNIGIVRSHRNWAARLAALAFRYQVNSEDDGDNHNKTIVWHPEKQLCPKCLPALFLRETGSATGVVID